MKNAKTTLIAILLTPVILTTFPAYPDQFEILGKPLAGINNEESEDMANQMPMSSAMAEDMEYMRGRNMRDMRRGNMGYRNDRDRSYAGMRHMQKPGMGYMRNKNMNHMNDRDMSYMRRRNMHGGRSADMGKMHDMNGMPMMQMMRERHAMMREHMTKMEKTLGNIEALLQQLVEQQKME